MRYYVSIKDREFEIDLQDGGEGLLAGIGNRRFNVDCAEIEEGMKYSVLIEGESFNVSLNPSSHSMDLILGGHLYRARVLDEREKGALALQGAKGNGGRQVVQSVMPGIVRKVFVTEGDEVASGMPLLILEAMKMENELCAEEAGRVAKVHVSEGQTVSSSDPLVTIE